MSYLVKETPTADIYQGIYWEAEIIYSNRHGNRIEYRGANSDRLWNVPGNRVESTIKRLKEGEDPDVVAQSFPIEFN